MADPAKPNKAWLAFWENLPLRLGAWYALLGGVVAALWPVLPRDAAGRLTGPVSRLIGGSGAVDAAVGLGKGAAERTLLAPAATHVGDVIVATTIAVIAAVCLTLPVAWTYMFARQKKGFQQALVQSLLILPVVVTGIVILVQNSLALAFGLGAIVAAVRFRTNIDDSKDAAFIFAAMAIGLACGVELAAAGVLSVLFNLVVMGLWYTDFGRAPANLEGEMAQRRLERALAVANRTGAFVARMDEEVLKALAPEQLEALAARAKRRKKKLTGEPTTEERAVGAAPATHPPAPPLDAEQVLRVYARDPAAARAAVEALLGEYLAEWRFLRVVPEGTDGVQRIDYLGRLAPNTIPQQVLYDVRTRSTPHVMRCELKPRGPDDA
ncbi:MAG: DUF4956 domain-containing protein [Gemmatimonadaceae bacterium]|jgi:hypothetical protein|nr:DUF4956 domain-containing protein [Gemmatimonadaceae bacterium]